MSESLGVSVLIHPLPHISQPQLRADLVKGRGSGQSSKSHRGRLDSSIICMILFLCLIEGRGCFLSLSSGVTDSEGNKKVPSTLAVPENLVASP